MTQAVVGVFHDRDSANRAVDGLIEAHFRPRQEIAVSVMDGDAVPHEVPVVHRTFVPIGVGLGVTIGAVVGALMVGAGVVPTFLEPWFDSLSGGPWVGVARGALFGIALGGLIGVLWGLTFWWDRPDFVGTPAGSQIRVSVDASDLHGRAQVAREILQQAGALDILENAGSQTYIQ